MNYLGAWVTSFPDSSVGEESARNAGDPSSIPGLGRSAGEGIGYPIQYSWASLVAQLVKNPPAMQETWVQSLDWEDPLEKEKLPFPVLWPEEFHGLYSPWGPKESDSTFTHTHIYLSMGGGLEWLSSSYRWGSGSSYTKVLNAEPRFLPPSVTSRRLGI